MTKEDKRVKTMTEIFADMISECDYDSDDFGEYLVEAIVDGLPKLDIAEDEAEKLKKHLIAFAEDIEDDARETVKEWEENARDWEDARRSAIR